MDFQNNHEKFYMRKSSTLENQNKKFSSFINKDLMNNSKNKKVGLEVMGSLKF